MEPQNSLQRNIGIIIGVIIILAVASISVTASMESLDSSSASLSASSTTVVAQLPPSTPSTSTPSPIITPPPIDNPKQTASVYKDGTYSATGSYMSPGGEDQVAVTLTLKNDIITDVSVNTTAGDGTSHRYQSRFTIGYKQYVLGKNIASVRLTNVSGSSLTPIGFNDALTQIKAQAKA